MEIYSHNESMTGFQLEVMRNDYSSLSSRAKIPPPGSIVSLPACPLRDLNASARSKAAPNLISSSGQDNSFFKASLNDLFPNKKTC